MSAPVGAERQPIANMHAQAKTRMAAPYTIVGKDAGPELSRRKARRSTESNAA
jgi:hypothetical protein